MNCELCHHDEKYHTAEGGCIECRCPLTDVETSPREYVQDSLTAAAVAFHLSDLDHTEWTRMLTEACESVAVAPTNEEPVHSREVVLDRYERAQLASLRRSSSRLAEIIDQRVKK